jgi:hypothetical protein
MQKPRPFNHKLIYIDERQERIRQAERRTNGTAADGVAANRLSFSRNQLQKGSVPRLSIPMLLSLLLIFIATALLVAFTI